MNSTGVDNGYGLFKNIEAKILSEMPLIKQRQANNRKLSVNLTDVDMRNENESYDGLDEDQIYVYLASDNEVVKEAFANYFLDHANIKIMRIRNIGQIVR